MTAAWTADELERIGAAEELQTTPLGADGAPRRPATPPASARVASSATAQATTLRLVPAGDEHD